MQLTLDPTQPSSPAFAADDHHRSDGREDAPELFQWTVARSIEDEVIALRIGGEVALSVVDDVVRTK